MVRVLVRVEAESTADPYVRYHGVSVDADLPAGFWGMVWKPEWYVTTSFSPFTVTLEYDLPAGKHFVIYGNSAVADFPWRARIYLNGELVAEGDVHRDKFLRVEFEVAAPTPPTPTPTPTAIPWWVWLAVGAVGLGVILFAVRKS